MRAQCDVADADVVAEPFGEAVPVADFHGDGDVAVLQGGGQATEGAGIDGAAGGVPEGDVEVAAGVGASVHAASVGEGVGVGHVDGQQPEQRG